MTPTCRNCSHRMAVAGSAVERSPNTPRFQTASPAVRYAKRWFRRLQRSAVSALPSSSTLRPSATSGRSLWTSIGRPEAHVREPLARALRAHLAIEDREDQDVPALAVIGPRLAQAALQPEAVAAQ